MVINQKFHPNIHVHQDLIVSVFHFHFPFPLFPNAPVRNTVRVGRPGTHNVLLAATRISCEFHCENLQPS